MESLEIPILESLEVVSSQFTIDDVVSRLDLLIASINNIETLIGYIFSIIVLYIVVNFIWIVLSKWLFGGV